VSAARLYREAPFDLAGGMAVRIAGRLESRVPRRHCGPSAGTFADEQLTAKVRALRRRRGDPARTVEAIHDEI